MSTIHRLHAVLFAALVVLTSALALQRAGSFEAGPGQDDLVDGRLAHAFESHYDAVFPARGFGINLWAALDYVLFREGRPGVVVGHDGWLYSDEEFRLGNEAEAEATRNLHAIVAVHDSLAERGVRLLVAVVPAKARVYPEHLGARRPPPLHDGAYARLQALLKAAAIPSAELYAPLRRGRVDAEAYLRTDTHWTPYGARIAASAIRDAAIPLGLRPVATTKFRGVLDGRAPYRGDLLNFLPLDPYFAWLLPPPDALERTHTEAPLAAGDLLGDAAPPRIALVGTSYSANPLWDFAGALEQALHEPVANYAKDGTGPFAPMFAYLGSEDFRRAPPQLVIWEFPERYLPTRQPLADGPKTAPQPTEGDSP